MVAKILICMALAVALLTIYDMSKAADRGMVITDVKLLENTGARAAAGWLESWRKHINGLKAQ